MKLSSLKNSRKHIKDSDVKAKLVQQMKDDIKETGFVHIDCPYEDDPFYTYICKNDWDSIIKLLNYLDPEAPEVEDDDDYMEMEIDWNNKEFVKKSLHYMSYDYSLDADKVGTGTPEALAVYTGKEQDCALGSLDELCQKAADEIIGWGLDIDDIHNIGI